MELIVATAVIAILAVIAIPSVNGMLTKGKVSAYEMDQSVLQATVDIWRNSIGKNMDRAYPILQGGKECLGALDVFSGVPSKAGCNPYIDIKSLVDQELLSNSAAIKSADTSKNITAVNNPSGSYGWWIDVGGIVKSDPVYIQGVYP